MATTDDITNGERAEKLAQQIRDAWSEIDADAAIDVRLRPDGKFDLRVVSERFADLDSSEREALMWTRIRRLPSSLTVRMTYALLVSPDEAKGYFDDSGED